jgi:zinc protease
MTSYFRSALAGALLLGLTGCSSPGFKFPDIALWTKKPRPEQSAPAAVTTSSVATPDAAGVETANLPKPSWPQSRSDIPADPNVRFGILPNGMRYAILRNATPPGQASIRLRFDVGSLDETDGEQGIAHFLEHMAFNGSTHIPEGELVKRLERLGLAFGADTNASTNYNETIYQLDLPHTDDPTLSAAMLAFREVASELTIAPDAVDRERGIVLSEERTRDSPSYRAYKSRMDFTMDGQRPPLRHPIGKVDILKSVSAQTIRSFYECWYRPERAVIVAVGDFDADDIERRIKTAFSDWKSSTPTPTEIDIGKPKVRAPDAALLVEPGSQTNLQMTWTQPPDLSPDSQAKRARGWRQRLVLAVLNRRLESVARGSTPPFIAAGGFANTQFKAVQMTTLIATSRPDSWNVALSSLDQEQRRLVKYGVRPDELAREITELRTRLTADAASAATRKTPDLADEIVGTLDESDVVTSPDEDLAGFERAIKDFSPDVAKGVIKDLFGGSGPLIFASGPTAIAGGKPAVLAALTASQQVAVSTPEGPRVTTWPYANFGVPSGIADQTEIPDLDAVQVRFNNGVRLIIKPTRFKDDQILVRVRIGSGLSGQKPDVQSLSWAAPAFVEAGLGKATAEDLERLLASNVYGAEIGQDEKSTLLSGSTRPEDLDVQMQVLAAFLTDPGWRPEALARMQTYTASLIDQYQATDDGVLQRDLPGLLHNGDRRWTFPTPSDLKYASMAGLKSALLPDLQTGALEIIIVGDTTVDKALAAVSQTFGALPPRSATRPTTALPSFPAPTSAPQSARHNGRADQASAVLGWPTTGFFESPREARTLSLLGEVLQLRLTDELREAQGLTYSPSVGSSSSQTFRTYGYIFAGIEAPPAKLDTFFTVTNGIASDLRNNLVSGDELSRARKPRLESLAKARQGNEYWLNQLGGASLDPRQLDAVRTVERDYQTISAAEIQAVARKYLKPETAWKFVVLPRAK